MDVAKLAGRIAGLDALDKVAEPLAAKVSETIGPDGKHVLSGAWMGHPLHPMLTDVPIGAFTSAAILDLIPGKTATRAARTLTGVGLLSSIPTAVAGASDWSDLSGEDRRTGLVHAASNAVGLILYTRSFWARIRGHHMKGRVWGLAGMAAMTLGGYLGGHLVYRRGVGVNQHAFDGSAGAHGSDEPGWTAIGRLTELPDGEPVVKSIAGLDVMVLRRGTTVVALANRCSHLGGPLAEGEIGVGSVTCPWHASMFDLADGSVVRGPATAPQPCFETRIDAGTVLVRSRAASVVDLTGETASRRAPSSI